MKRTIKMILLLVFLAWLVVFLVGRIRWPIHLAQGWSPPVIVTDTENADAGGGFLHKWHDTIILLRDQYDKSSSTCSIMIRNNDSSNTWSQLPPLSVADKNAFFDPTFDEANNRMIFERGHIENDQLLMSVIFVRMSENRRIQVETESKWTMDKKSLLGVTGTNVNVHSVDWGSGVKNDSNIYLPYCVRGETKRGKIIYGDEGPFNNGAFHSTDSGTTWQMERISNFEAYEPAVRKTESYYYYIASKNNGLSLWFSRKSVSGGSWDEPKLLTKTSANIRGGSVLAENDMVHACWLDRRHEKWQFNFNAPTLGNYEVVYCRRKDSNSTWQKDTTLSKGLLFSYWANMSVEGDKIVVAWDGGESRPSYDIYYATSKDGGKTWTRPLKVTDRAKDGFTSERPQVALQNGVIHLFYAQGKWNPHAQVRSQGGWPVYYQQRPFPD